MIQLLVSSDPSQVVTKFMNRSQEDFAFVLETLIIFLWKRKVIVELHNFAVCRYNFHIHLPRFQCTPAKKTK